MNNFFESNRKKLYKHIKEKSLVVLFAGKAPLKIGDEKYMFAPNRNFYYITGVDKENIIFVMFKYNNIINEYLYIEKYDEIESKWTGEVISPQKSTEISGIENIKYLDCFYDDIYFIIFNNRIEQIYIDCENRYGIPSSSIQFAQNIKNNYPAVNIIDIYPIISKLRTIKDEYEIKNICRAVEITKRALYMMVKLTQPGLKEYEIEAYFDFALKKMGVKDKAFQTIAASGKNATVLHYVENNSETKDGDLILFDLGAQYNYYNADITRTFPVNGKFTKRQKQIYNIVLQGQSLVIESIKPGIEFKMLNEILKDYYYIELRKIGLVENKEDVDKYYYHNVSHFLGLETHDTGRNNEGILKEGMVLTVEPGLYISEESIGIRIEDDVLVTKNGCEILSKDIIKTIDEIEAFMENDE